MGMKRDNGFYVNGIKVTYKSRGYWNAIFLHNTLSLKQAKEELEKYFFISAIYVPSDTKAYGMYESEGVSYYFRLRARLKRDLLPQLQKEKSY